MAAALILHKTGEGTFNAKRKEKVDGSFRETVPTFYQIWNLWGGGGSSLGNGATKALAACLVETFIQRLLLVLSLS